MLDALQAKEIAKTNFSALENDLELNNEYFRSISNLVEEQAKRSQTSVNIPYREDQRFNDIMTVLKWKGYKIKHYRCTNWCGVQPIIRTLNTRNFNMNQHLMELKVLV